MEACFHQGDKKRYFYITIQTFSHNLSFYFTIQDFFFAILTKKKILSVGLCGINSQFWVERKSEMWEINLHIVRTKIRILRKSQNNNNIYTCIYIYYIYFFFFISNSMAETKQIQASYKLRISNIISGMWESKKEFKVYNLQFWICILYFFPLRIKIKNLYYIFCFIPWWKWASITNRWAMSEIFFWHLFIYFCLLF